MYGDPADSMYTVLKGHTVVNMSLGLRATKTWEAFVWARNLTGTNYMQNVTVQAGNSGQVVGTPNSPSPPESFHCLARSLEANTSAR